MDPQIIAAGIIGFQPWQNFIPQDIITNFVFILLLGICIKIELASFFHRKLQLQEALLKVGAWILKCIYFRACLNLLVKKLFEFNFINLNRKESVNRLSTVNSTNKQK